MPHSKRAQYLIDLNRRESTTFTSADATELRRQYRAQHPTAIAILKCMDGRVKIPYITKLPAGIVQPFRNIGGMFDLGWPHFGEVFEDWYNWAISEGRDCLVLNTYHFSSGDPHRGCAGHGYDTGKAIRCAEGLTAQFERVYGEAHSTLYPITVGIETDEDLLIFHGHKEDQTLSTADCHGLSEEELLQRLHKLYPDMKRQVLLDLIPLITGNLTHQLEIRKAKRGAQEIEHNEATIVVGRGVDWFDKPNIALIIGPYSPELKQPIATAGKVIKQNIAAGRVDPKDGIVILATASTFNHSGARWNRAKEKANMLATLAYETIAESHPDLVEHLDVVAGVMDMHTRKLHLQDFPQV